MHTRALAHTSTPAQLLSLDALTHRCRAPSRAPTRVMLRRRAVRSLVQHAARVRGADGPLPRLGVPLTARTVPRVSTRDRRGLCHSTAVHRADLVLSTASTRHYAVIAGMRRRRMSSRKYYPPAPLVVAATASGAGLTDIPESATVRSLVRPWRGFGVGVGRKARYGTVHRCQHAVVSCMEEVAFLLHVRCTEHVACYMMHAACCMLHDASGAHGEWLDLVCGGNQPHRVSMWLLVDCRRV